MPIQRITSGILADGAIVAADIADGIVTSSKLASTLSISGNFLANNVTANAKVHFADSDSSHFIAFQAPTTVSSNVTFTLPAADGTNGQVIQTDGSGALSFATPSSTSDKIEEGDSKVEVTDAGTGKVEVTVDNVEVADFTTGAIVFNETGADQDFRVESDTNPNMFIVDASQDRVFIGDTAVNVNGNPTNQCFSFNEGSAFAFSFTGPNAYINISTPGTVINLRHQGLNSGSIVINTSTVAYNTSSDYRLKENIATMTGALARIALLNPVTYKWKADGSAGEGFIAHELQAVCPDAVSGDKDAVNEDGSIKPRRGHLILGSHPDCGNTRTQSNQRCPSKPHRNPRSKSSSTGDEHMSKLVKKVN
jgi:hypothetical protein